MSWRVPLSDLNYGAEEEAAVHRVLRSRWLSMGPEVLAFEEEFAQFVGVKHAVAVSSGTAALHLILVALGVGDDPDGADEVVQPALNFVASANLTRRVGAVPVFADIVSLSEPTLDPASIEAAITEQTRAVIVMAYGGIAPRMAEIAALCDRHGVALIEDACHALGVSARVADEQQRALGAWGDAAAFSFFSNKNLATGEGGMITTDRDDLAARFRALRSHGMTRPTYERHQSRRLGYDIVESGWNYRLDEIHAALGRTQLAKLVEGNRLRIRAAEYYDRSIGEALGSQRDAWVLPGVDAGICRADTAAHVFPVGLPVGTEREPFALQVLEAGIQVSHHYPAVVTLSAFGGPQPDAAVSPAADVPVSLEFADRELTLPLWPGITSEQQDLVVETVVSVAKPGR